MWTSRLHVTRPGLLTTLQDSGRDGYQSFGIPRSGFMDSPSARIANILVANDPSAPLIEMNIVGGDFEVNGDTYLAITGADMNATLDGKKVNLYETIYASHGSQLSFQSTTNGSRTYLAIGGKIDHSSWLKSVSAYSNIKIPILGPNILNKGSQINISNKKLITKKVCPETFRYKPSDTQSIRVLQGPEYTWFDDNQLDFFVNENFTIDQKSNRMAINLKERITDYRVKQELISSGTIPGTIQISNDGSPIILLQEGGTTGGYPRIGKIIDQDINRLAQLQIGAQFKFEFISYREAAALVKQENEDWQKLTQYLAYKQS